MKFKKTHPDAKIPTRGSKNAAGLDLYALSAGVIYPRARLLVDTGVAVEISEGSYGQIAPRSSLALKGIDLGAGVVDADFRDSIKVLLINNSVSTFEFKAGDRIAQLLELLVGQDEPEEVDELSETERNKGGFGSSGV